MKSLRSSDLLLDLSRFAVPVGIMLSLMGNVVGQSPKTDQPQAAKGKITLSIGQGPPTKQLTLASEMPWTWGH